MRVGLLYFSITLAMVTVLPEPVAFIENGTTERQRVMLTDLYELSTNPPEVSPPAIMVVGEVGNSLFILLLSSLFRPLSFALAKSHLT